VNRRQEREDHPGVVGTPIQQASAQANGWNPWQKRAVPRDGQQFRTQRGKMGQNRGSGVERTHQILLGERPSAMETSVRQCFLPWLLEVQ